MKTQVTVQTLLSDLVEDRALARELGQPSAAIAATQLSAKLVGLLVDRKESGAPGDFAAQTPEAVVERVRQELGEATADALLAALAQQDAAPAEPEPAAPVERSADDTLQ